MQKKLDIANKKIVIVGAGLSGCTAARLFADCGADVTIFESRDHIGGNCADQMLGNVRVHTYGPHIFHTDDEEVFEFLSRFTEWIPFELRPKGNTRFGIVPLPYSRATVSAIGRELSQDEIRQAFFKDYSEKQWGVPFEEIPKTITNRIPQTADDENPTWFRHQKYQCLPKDGYTAMFENMLNHPNIKVVLNSKPDEWKFAPRDFLVYTGKIDEYFDYCHGRLPYRSLEFHHKAFVPRQETFIINQNKADTPYTRVYDHSYFNPDHKGLTVITSELPKECGPDDIPYYPIPWGDSQRLYNLYDEMKSQEKDVWFTGRLSQYKYLDMWMAVKHTLFGFAKIKE